MSKYLPCEVCGIAVKQPETGRPRKYCSDRHKERAKRKRERERDRTAADLARASVPAFAAGTFNEPACHVCGQRAATVGSPPLLCASCAQPRSA